MGCPAIKYESFIFVENKCMRTLFSLIFLMFFFASCDDGDIIVTSFDFEDEDLSICGTDRNKVLYHINNEDIFETISLTISGSQISNIPGVITTDPAQPIAFNLTGDNEIVYRTYNAEVPSDYFCRDVPPSSPVVVEEFRSVGGNVIITTNIMDVADHDGDGVPSALEGMDEGLDTDGDGIPDYLDIDDDGDNVPTRVEINVDTDQDPTDDSLPDTDGDGIPNYLDPNDDGDDILTRFEVTEDFPRPNDPANQNDEGVPFYLDPTIEQNFPGVDFVIENVIDVVYFSSVVVNDLKLQKQGGDGEQISFITYNFGNFQSVPIETLIEPASPEEEEN